MLTFKHALNDKNELVTLIYAMESHFFLHWYPKSCSKSMMVRELGFNELFPFLSKNSVQVCACVQYVPSKKKKRETFQYISIYIYITYYTHYLDHLI